MARRSIGFNAFDLGLGVVRQQSRSGFPLVLLMVAGASFLVFNSGAADTVWQQLRNSVSRDVGAARHFNICSGSRALTCVVDGDTVRIDGTSIRIADIDTPEVFSSRCADELARGQAATRRMAELLNAGAFEMEMYDHRDEDMYGRKLRVLSRNGQSLGQILVSEGLARTWDGARRGLC